MRTSKLTDNNHSRRVRTTLRLSLVDIQAPAPHCFSPGTQYAQLRSNLIHLRPILAKTGEKEMFGTLRHNFKQLGKPRQSPESFGKVCKCLGINSPASSGKVRKGRGKLRKSLNANALSRFFMVLAHFSSRNGPTTQHNMRLSNSFINH